MAQFTLIEQMASYYNLSPKTMQKYNLFEQDNSVTIWQKGKASVHFLKDSVASEPRNKNVSQMSYDGTARHAYQIALNVVNDKQLKAQFAEMGVTL